MRYNSHRTGDGSNRIRRVTDYERGLRKLFSENLRMVEGTTMKICICILLLALGATPVEQSLRQIAREQGGSASNSMDYFTPVTTVSQLSKDSDYIVHAKVVRANTVLTFEERLVATEYTILPLGVLKHRTSLNSSSKPGYLPTTVVRRVGGTMIEGEYRYSTTNRAMPEADAPRVGDEVIWFLQYNAEDKVFMFTGGAFGAFHVRDGEVQPLTREVASRRGDRPIALAAFLRDLQASIAKE